MKSLDVFVPKHGSRLRQQLTPGCAIVSSADLVAAGNPTRWWNGNVLIDLEDNRYHFVNVQNYADKVLIAAGRHVTQYPTVARMLVERADLIWVGTYDYESHTLVITNEHELKDWSPE
jgi:hypothetical protein